MNKMNNAKKKLIVVKAKPLEDAELNGQFELELCWCVQQLESTLNDGKLNKRTAEDTARRIKILRSENAPFIKKRQIMKAALGDYRQKMRDDEKKMSLSVKQIKFTALAPPTSKNKNLDNNTRSLSFVKKSAIMSADKDFCFNFITDNHIDGEATKHVEAIPINNEKFHLNLTNGNNFKFNFTINDEVNDQINFDTMKI